jgi:diguanylate cyclase (GGDEF)-like protein
MSQPGDLNLSKRLMAWSTIALLAFMAAGVFSGRTIYSQNKVTENALRVSQARANSASQAQAAILLMGKAQAQLVAAPDSKERRIDAVLTIEAASALDESIQRLQQELGNSSHVTELFGLLEEIAPAKMRVIRAVSSNDLPTARIEMQGMQPAMKRIEQISGTLVLEENARLLTAVVKQGEQSRLTLRVLGVLAIGCVVVGVIVARRLSAQQKQITQQSADVIAVNARLTQEMRERESVQNELNRQNEMRSARGALLAGMSRLLQSSDNMGEAVSIILGFAPKIFSEFRGALYLSTSQGLFEVSGGWADSGEPAVEPFQANSCWALRTGQRHFAKAGDRTAQCAHVVSTEGSYLCIPIMSQQGAVGLLHLQTNTTSRAPLDAEFLLADTFVEQLALSISNLKLQEALRRQSTRDALTGLFNRRHLETSMEREIRRAARTDQQVGVIMFDIDHFKTFNDTFGHEAGDSVLREVGNFLSNCVRAEDIPCRFGGEEFLLILPGANLDGARSRAERLRHALKDLNVMHQGRPVGSITISAGVAAFPAQGVSVKEVIAAADGALYRAKSNGRNQVVVAGFAEATSSATTGAGSAGIAT